MLTCYWFRNMALGSYFFTKIGCNGLVSFHLLGCFISCIAVLQLTNDAVDPTTWRNRNVQVVGWSIARIYFHFGVGKSTLDSLFHALPLMTVCLC